MRIQRNRLMMRLSIPTARNILHSRMRLNANERMDKSIVGSSNIFFFKICLMRWMPMKHFMGDTIIKTLLDGRRRHLGIIFSIWRTFTLLSILIIIIGHALWFTWKTSGSSITILLRFLARMINIWKVICSTDMIWMRKYEHIKPDKWKLVLCAKTVPQQKNRVDCGAFICMYC